MSSSSLVFVGPYPNRSLYVCDCCKCDCEDGTPGTLSNTGSPVRYGDGQILMSETDLSWSGFGMSWGHTRHYVNQLSENDSGVNGNSWLVRQLEYLTMVGADRICVVRSASASLWFSRVGTSDDWVADFGVHATLEHGGGEYTLFIEDTGRIFKFWDENSTNPHQPAGLLAAMTGPGGQAASLIYDSSGRLESWNFTAEGQTVRFEYAYTADDRIDSVMMAVDGTPLRAVAFDYYSTGDTRGNAGDLEGVELSQWDGADWQSLRRSHYRYYVSVGPLDPDQATPPVPDTGFIHGLRYVVGPEAYARMVIDGYPPEEATVAEIRNYADNRFTYDTSKRVTMEVVRGNAYRDTFEYSAPSGLGEGYNVWLYKVTVTRPDFSTLTVYSNYIYQTMLTILEDGSSKWYDGTKFTDDEGRVYERFTSKAVSTPNESNAWLFSANSNGLIYVNNWLTSGSLAGHLANEAIKDGTGSEVKLREFNWSTFTRNGRVIVKKGTETVYRSDTGGGSSPVSTSFDYEWHGPDVGGTYQISAIITTLPGVANADNGNDTAGITDQRFDILGRSTWSMDERGYITLRRYDDAVDGRMSQMVQDVDTSLYDDVPEGWSTPDEPGAGLNLITNYSYDLFGRQIEQLGPVHEIDDAGTARLVRTATWTAYQDLKREVASARGMTWGEFPYLSSRRIGPVSVSRSDRAGRAVEQIRAVPASDGRPGSGDYYPQDSWTGYTRNSYDNQGFQLWQRVYHTIPGSGAGLERQNFDQTDFHYDDMLRRTRTTSPGGTITWNVFDVRSNITATFVGTDATGGTDDDPDGSGAPNNMVLVSTNYFDGSVPGLPVDKGNNLLTLSVQQVSASETRATTYDYDFRERLIGTTGPLSDFVGYLYDNRSNVILEERWGASAIQSRTERFFDSRNRSYRKKVWSVSGVVGTKSIATDYWRDQSGNVIKQRDMGSRAWTKTVFDGLTRPLKTYLCFRTSGSEGDTNSVANNYVVEQTFNFWNAASDLVQTEFFQAFDDNSTTGELVPAGDSGPQARRSTICLWSDGIGRTIASAKYGTNAGMGVARPSLVPAGSDTVLVNLTAYDFSGRISITTNPLGLQAAVSYDAMDRVLRAVENAGAADASAMRVSEQAYTPDGALETLTLKNAVTGDQVTRWIYGSSRYGEEDAEGIATSTLLQAKVYPDNPLSLDPASDGGSDRVSYLYNRLGQATQITDQTGTIRSLEYDDRGRLQYDRVDLPDDSKVDGTILCMGYTYDDLDRWVGAFSYTDRDADLGDSAYNEVSRSYNGFGQIAEESQTYHDQSGPTPPVAYTYADGTNNVIYRQTVGYPDGRVIGLRYDAPAAGYLPRLSAVTDETAETELASWSFIGASRVVAARYEQPGIQLVRKAQASGNVPSDSGPDDPYVGLDRFGRDIDHRWVKEDDDIERIQYGYDAGSRRLWRRETVAPDGGQDEAYTYDGLSQVTTRQRGTLNLGATAIGTEEASESFDYDPTGNWQQYLARTGELELLQTRTNNEANEIVTIDGSATGVEYDAAGRMTEVPAGDDPADGIYKLTWDAWSRLVKVSLVIGTTTISGRVYEYDPRHRRLTVTATAGPDFHSVAYSDDNWKIIEERIESAEGNYSQQYIYGIRGRNDLILRDRREDSSSSSSGEGDGRHYAVCDAMGSKTAITSDSGVVVERYGYSAFGMSRVMTPGFEELLSSEFDWQVRFHGETRDADTGWYNYGYRYYLPELGKWPSKDSIGEIGGVNIYSFAFNNPIKFFDVLGNWVAETDGANMDEFPNSFEGMKNAQAECKKLDNSEEWKKWANSCPEGKRACILDLGSGKGRWSPFGSSKVPDEVIWFVIATKKFEGLVTFKESQTFEIKIPAGEIGDVGADLTIEKNTKQIAKGELALVVPCYKETTLFKCMEGINNAEYPCGETQPVVENYINADTSGETFKRVKTNLHVGEMKIVWNSLSVAAQGEEYKLGGVGVNLGVVKISN